MRIFYHKKWTRLRGSGHFTKTSSTVTGITSFFAVYQVVSFLSLHSYINKEEISSISLQKIKLTTELRSALPGLTPLLFPHPKISSPKEPTPPAQRQFPLSHGVLPQCPPVALGTISCLALLLPIQPRQQRAFLLSPYLSIWYCLISQAVVLTRRALPASFDTSFDFAQDKLRLVCGFPKMYPA